MQPLATGRLLPAQRGVSKIGRLAVLANRRQQGIGAAMLHKLVDLARLRGDQTVQLHAQTQAQGFYERLGFCADGPVFQEVGINHVLMQLKI
jgi:predicted GNAT family N-acyltransferase